MYSREKLSEFIDIALKRNVANRVISELLSELEQIPVKFESDTLNTDDLPKYLNEGEVFTENPNYQTEAKDFSIYDNTGKLLLTINEDESLIGRGSLRFTVPFTSNEDKEAFLDFCDRLQKNHAIKYPLDEA